MRNRRLFARFSAGFRLNLLGVLILCVGLATAFWLFRDAGEDASDVISYVIADGQSYPVTTADSKLYRLQLERFGGKMAVFADDLNRWLASLTHGKGLAGVIALLAIVMAVGCFLAARRHSPGDAAE